MEFSSALIAAEMLLVGFRQESALMMIEPPGQLVGSAVFEIDNDVLLAAEEILIDALARLVRQAFVFNIRRGINLAAIKRRKDGRRRESVKTVVVVKHS